MSQPRVAVIGGGAAGFFSAIACAEANPSARVIIFERSKRFLTKVAISGGGRCNVTHSCFDPRELVQRYPRGRRELLGAFHSWQPQDTINWFSERGVTLKTESDGRMFPTTDSSATIIDCLTRSASDTAVELRSNTGIQRAEISANGQFELELADGSSEQFDKLVIATGGGKNSIGHAIAKSFGHTITPLAPSLFTFHIDDPRIEGLSGLSVPYATVSSKAHKLSHSGPALITHWGLSGPAILKLSAYGARAFQESEYKFELEVNWLGDVKRESALEILRDTKQSSGRRQPNAHCPFDLPKRLWEKLVRASDIEASAQWSDVSKKQIAKLSEQLVSCRFSVSGKSMNKEEFVTCGGVKLSEINFKRMESKLAPNLFFAGETLDIDGITGGFNFQAAWTTGKLAGAAAAE